MAGFIVPLEVMEKTRTGPQMKVHDGNAVSVELVKSSVFTSPVSNASCHRQQGTCSSLSLSL